MLTKKAKDMTERQENILKMVTSRYISSGEPVGSKSIADPLGISSATVRNEMARLGELGFLEQTHTSSGRIPSSKGILYYAENLIESSGLDDREKYLLDIGMSSATSDITETLDRAVFLLSEATNLAAVATTPISRRVTLKSVQLVPLEEKQVMLVVKMTNGALKHSTLRLSDTLDSSLGELFYTVCRNYFIGASADDFSAASVQSLICSFGARTLEISPFIITLLELMKSAEKSECRTHAVPRLLEISGIDIGSYINLNLSLSDNTLTSFLNGARNDINFYIEPSIISRRLPTMSVVSARYTCGDAFGSLAVVGPTRMDYSRIKPIVKYIADLVQIQ